MAAECDNVLLLGEESSSAPEFVQQPGKLRLRRIAIAALSGVAATAIWRGSFAAQSRNHFFAEGVMSAAALKLDPWINNAKLCTDFWATETTLEGAVLKSKFWPHRFSDVNWQEHCSGDSKDECTSRLIEKYVGDFFDAVKDNIVAEVGADIDKNWIPHNNDREMERWKERVIKNVRDKSKAIEGITALEGHAPLEWLPYASVNAIVAAGGAAKAWTDAQTHCDGAKLVKCSNRGWICDAMEEERPIAPVSTCMPNYKPWKTIAPYFSTVVPSLLCHESDDACRSYDEVLEDEESLTAANKLAEMIKDYKYTGNHDLTNEQLARCKHLLQPFQDEDWISATLTALDVRECIASGGVTPKFPNSRSWVRNCIPGRTGLTNGVDTPRSFGWPGFVLEFISEYQIPGSDCVRDYGGDLDVRGHCPSTCEDGSSLSGHLKMHSTFRDYNVIHNRVTGVSAEYRNLGQDKIALAKYLMWKNGPLIGLVERTLELVSCTRDDQVLFSQGCDGDNWGEGDTGELLSDVSAVTVYGWGELAGQPYYRFVSRFQSEGRINTCGVKAFVVPALEKKSLHPQYYDSALNAFKAESVCKRPGGFCTQATAGYTDTEDCDGDGVLDHWCYLPQDVGTYEAFISSRHDCTVTEKSCRRSVLPGRTFGCQRPLGWCMHDETYRRNIDCDGDGHFDHVCEKLDHSGFISSSQDCIDTWEEGTTGRKCEPHPVLLDEDASITYKLVHVAGNCVPHSGSQCFKSHDDWPKLNYKPNSNCKFRVEAKNHKMKGASDADCGKTPEPDVQLTLEIIYEDVERPEFNVNGAWWGDKFEVYDPNSVLVNPIRIGDEEDCALKGTCLDWRSVVEQEIRVFDQSSVSFQADGTIEREGWLVCLREKSKIPEEIYPVRCNDIGDDIWSKLKGVSDRKTYVKVKCDMDQCHKGEVKPVTENSARFYRTTNICDAGWNVVKGNRFDVQFWGFRTDDEADADTTFREPTFEVLAA